MTITFENPESRYSMKCYIDGKQANMRAKGGIRGPVFSDENETIIVKVAIQERLGFNQSFAESVVYGLLKVGHRKYFAKMLLSGHLLDKDGERCGYWIVQEFVVGESPYKMSHEKLNKHMDKLIKICNNYGITDLHEGNWVFRGTVPVCMDYGMAYSKAVEKAAKNS